jgi:hypothetical protein
MLSEGSRVMLSEGSRVMLVDMLALLSSRAFASFCDHIKRTHMLCAWSVGLVGQRWCVFICVLVVSPSRSMPFGFSRRPRVCHVTTMLSGVLKISGDHVFSKTKIIGENS